MGCKLIGELNPMWKGGIKRQGQGYILIYSPEHPFCSKRKYVLEHRLIMEKHIGRYLTKKEIVHHKNGIRDDNRIENLELFNNQSEHLKNHFKECRNHIGFKPRNKQVFSLPFPKPEKEGEKISFVIQNYRLFKVSKCLKCNELFWHNALSKAKICCMQHYKRKIYWEK